ncbi:unnamed protein product [Choristocarpus tenellus]
MRSSHAACWLGCQIFAFLVWRTSGFVPSPPHSSLTPRHTRKWAKVRRTMMVNPVTEIVATPTTKTEGRVLDLAIVGGGPAGLALALALKRKGLDVCVYESVSNIKERGAAVFLQGFGVGALEDILPGLGEEAIRAGRVVQYIHLLRPISGETIFKLDISRMKELVGYPFIGITRFALQRVLMAHLDKENIELGCRLKELNADGPGGLAELTFEGKDMPVRAKAVVGADGRRSSVRSKVLEPIKEDTNEMLVWWALSDTAEKPPAPEGEFRMSYGNGGSIYYGEVGENTTMWSLTSFERGGVDIEADPEVQKEEALEVITSWPEEVKDVVRNTANSRMIVTNVADSPVQWLRWSKEPSVTLIGDAAHAMFPSLGMGVTSALQDVVALASCVGEADESLETAFKKYEKMRIFPTALVQVFSRVGMWLIENILCM